MSMASAAERPPAMGTIYRWFAAWRDDGRFERINHALVMVDRERVGRYASPTAAIIRQDYRGGRATRLRWKEDQRT
jgi:transposase